jgi:hypothetical protein
MGCQLRVSSRSLVTVECVETLTTDILDAQFPIELPPRKSEI